MTRSPRRWASPTSSSWMNLEINRRNYEAIEPGFPIFPDYRCWITTSTSATIFNTSSLRWTKLLRSRGIESLLRCTRKTSSLVVTSGRGATDGTVPLLLSACGARAAGDQTGCQFGDCHADRHGDRKGDTRHSLDLARHRIGSLLGGCASATAPRKSRRSCRRTAPTPGTAGTGGLPPQITSKPTKSCVPSGRKPHASAHASTTAMTCST